MEVRRGIWRLEILRVGGNAYLWANRVQPVERKKGRSNIPEWKDGIQ